MEADFADKDVIELESAALELRMGESPDHRQRLENALSAVLEPVRRAHPDADPWSTRFNRDDGVILWETTWVSASQLNLVGILWWADGSADPLWAEVTFDDVAGGLARWEIRACGKDGPWGQKEIDRLWRRGRLTRDGIDWMFSAAGG